MSLVRTQPLEISKQITVIHSGIDNLTDTLQKTVGATLTRTLTLKAATQVNASAAAPVANGSAAAPAANGSATAAHGDHKVADQKTVVPESSEIELTTEVIGVNAYDHAPQNKAPKRSNVVVLDFDQNTELHLQVACAKEKLAQIQHLDRVAFVITLNNYVDKKDSKAAAPADSGDAKAPTAAEAAPGGPVTAVISKAAVLAEVKKTLTGPFHFPAEVLEYNSGALQGLEAIRHAVHMATIAQLPTHWNLPSADLAQQIAAFKEVYKILSDNETAWIKKIPGFRPSNILPQLEGKSDLEAEKVITANLHDAKAKKAWDIAIAHYKNLKNETVLVDIHQYGFANSGLISQTKAFVPTNPPVVIGEPTWKEKASAFFSTPTIWREKTLREGLAANTIRLKGNLDEKSRAKTIDTALQQSDATLAAARRSNP